MERGADPEAMVVVLGAGSVPADVLAAVRRWDRPSLRRLACSLWWFGCRGITLQFSVLSALQQLFPCIGDSWTACGAPAELCFATRCIGWTKLLFHLNMLRSKLQLFGSRGGSSTAAGASHAFGGVTCFGHPTSIPCRRSQETEPGVGGCSARGPAATYLTVVWERGLFWTCRCALACTAVRWMLC